MKPSQTANNRGRSPTRKTAVKAAKRKAPAKKKPKPDPWADWHPSRRLPNEKWEAFVLLIFQATRTGPDCSANHTDAYCRVYPKSSREAARRSAADILTKPDVAARLEWLKEEAERRAIGTVEEADRILWELVSAKLNDYCVQLPDGTRVLSYDENSPKPHALKKVKCRQVTTEDESEVRDLEYEIHDTKAALELYYKRHDHMPATKVDAKVTMTLAEALDAVEAEEAQS